MIASAETSDMYFQFAVPLALLEGDERIHERIPYKSWLYHPLPILPPGLGKWLLVLRLLFRRYPLVVYLRGSFPFLLLLSC